MSHILTEWLNSVARFDKKITPQSMDSNFTSGYYFGYVLDSLGFEDDFELKYVDSDATDALIKNYTNLEKTLRERLKIDLSSQHTLDLINGKPGSCARLLYEIKLAADSLSIHKKASKKIAPAPDRRFESYPSSPVENTSTNLGSQFEQVQTPYEAQKALQFARLLQSKLKRKNQFVPKEKYQEPPSLKVELPPIPKSVKEKVAQMLSTPSTASSGNNPVIEKVPMTWEPESSQAPSLPIKSKIPKISAKDLSSSIDAFESKLLYRNNNGASIPLSDEQVSSFLKSNAGLDPSLHMNELQKILENPEVLNANVTEQYLETIKFNRIEAETSRREQEKRRKRVMLLQQQTQQEMEADRLNGLIESKLLRQSKQERRIAEQLLQIRHEKRVILENRLFREQQYKEYRQKEYEEALDRERDLYKTAQDEYRQQVGMQMAQHFEIIEEKKRLKREKNTETLTKLVYDILALAFKVSDYRVLNDKADVPYRKMRQWKILLTKEVPLINSAEVPLLEDAIPPASDEIIIHEPEKPPQSTHLSETVKLLDSSDFDDYLNYQGYWRKGYDSIYAGDGNIKKPHQKRNMMLANLIDDLFKLTAAPIEIYKVIPIPAVPMRISIIGKKYSGKIVVARTLAQKFDMAIISMDDLIREAIAMADITVKKPKGNADKEKSDRKVLTKQQIGAKLQALMMDGQKPDDTLLVALIIDAMAQEPERSGGYILVDFPRNKMQAQLLERELSGFEDPKPVKKGDLKRVKDKERATTGRNRSLIAATEGGDENMNANATSALDAVFLLDVDTSVAISRAAGQMIDPLTGEKYHIEYHPPPSNVPGTFERLVPIEDQAKEIAQLQYQLAAFEEEESSLKEWLEQFKTLHVINANRKPEKTEKKVEEHLGEVIKKINTANKDATQTMELPEVHDKAEDTPAESLTKSNSVNLLNRDSLEVKMTTGPDGTVDMTATSGLSKPTTIEKLLPTKEFGLVLIEQWKLIESTYTDILKFDFRSVRRITDSSFLYFYNVKANFAEFLKRPDLEQELVETFQFEYNAIEEDFRADPDVKAELHQRLEELKERLWDFADKRRDEAESERIAIIEDRWIEDQSYTLANIVISMVQAETDKFLAVRQLLIDIQKNSKGVPLVELPKNSIKVPFLNLAGSPPIELGTALIAISEHNASQRRDNNTQVQVKEVKAPPKDQAKEKKEKVPANQKPAKNADAKAAVATTVEKENTTLPDPESSVFPDINGAVEFVLQTLASPEYNVMSYFESAEKRSLENINSEEKTLTEAGKILELEEILFKERLEVIRRVSSSILKELRKKCLEVYTKLDDWIGERYRAEIEAAKDLVLFIKEAVEKEARLPNLIYLDGEKLMLDYSTLVFRPPEPPRPESPTEKQLNDNFTIIQLKNLALQLNHIAPTGVISMRTFVELLTKVATMQCASDPLPEGYMTADPPLLYQTLSILDPFDTGMVSWRKFLMINAHIGPLPDETINETKLLFENHMTNQTQPTVEEVERMMFWFEHEKVDTTVEFDRPRKLKAAILEIFSFVGELRPWSTNSTKSQGTEPMVENQQQTSVPAILNNGTPIEFTELPTSSKVQTPQPIEEESKVPFFDYVDFLLCLCLDETPMEALRKAFIVFEDAERTLSKGEINIVFQHFLHPVSTSDRIKDVAASSNPFSAYRLNNLFSGPKKRFSFQEFAAAAKEHDMADWLECPLYGCEDLTIGASSRPTSAKKQ